LASSTDVVPFATVEGVAAADAIKHVVSLKPGQMVVCRASDDLIAMRTAHDGLKSREKIISLSSPAPKRKIDFNGRISEQIEHEVCLGSTFYDVIASKRHKDLLTHCANQVIVVIGPKEGVKPIEVVAPSPPVAMPEPTSTRTGRRARR
jgi:hypothetical protein